MFSSRLGSESSLYGISKGQCVSESTLSVFLTPDFHLAHLLGVWLSFLGAIDPVR